MKTITCILALLSFGKIATAQDTIVQTNGATIIGVVQEVGTSEIKYKKYDNRQTSPVYDISKYGVSAIKYADGSSDKFAATAQPLTYTLAIPAQPVVADTTPKAKMSFYFGARTSLLNSYSATSVNNYWENLFNGESGNGSLKLSSGNTQLNNYMIGWSYISPKQNNFGFEMQYETTSGSGIQNSASFDDGTTGNLHVNFSAINTTFIYLHGFDTTDKLQVGMEASLDVGFIHGTESDIFSSSSSSPNAGRTVSNDYDDAHVGSHIALVGRYFMGKQQNFGLELRAGYRFMNMSSFGESNWEDTQTDNPGFNMSGPFISAGLIIQFKSTPATGSPYSYCGCYS
ncbi:MAG TPA: hypothetical protein VK806_11630 [Bacteroidia bacterium]|nr:hypothetical protein [Bacteroidia bacterium]